jgi:hypothetical protein
MASHDAAFGREFLARGLDMMRNDRQVYPDCPDPALFDALEEIAPPAPERGIRVLQQFSARTYNVEPVAQAAVMRIPTASSCWIPVYLDWGGWNAVPSNLELAAVARHWHETWGARLIAISSDQLELRVSGKPQSHAEAVALLREQYCLSGDNWEFDKAVLEEAAAHLRVADSREFWWD